MGFFKNPIHIADNEEISVIGMGQVDTTPVLDPDQLTANQLGLLRGLLKQLQDGTMKTEINGSLANVVVLQSGATVAGNGTPYTPTTDVALTFVVTGSSTSRTIDFEIADPIKGVYQKLALATKLGDTTYTPQQQTTGGTNTAPEIWQIDIPANFSFRTSVFTVAGGDVNISGNAKVVL